MRCPYCQREIPADAYEKEKQIWRPWDSPYPDHTGYPQDSTTWSPDSWTGADDIADAYPPHWWLK